MPCSTRVRTMPCTVDGARSSLAASSDRLMRRAPWSAVSTRIARSTDWITCVSLLDLTSDEEVCRTLLRPVNRESSLPHIIRHYQMLFDSRAQGEGQHMLD